VLGGHIPDRNGASTLLDCLSAPSKIGRRSAIHGLFHAVEWIPGIRNNVVDALQSAAANDPDPLLREFSAHMAADIENGAMEHRREPVFADEC